MFEGTELVFNTKEPRFPTVKVVICTLTIPCCQTRLVNPAVLRSRQQRDLSRREENWYGNTSDEFLSPHCTTLDCESLITIKLLGYLHQHCVTSRWTTKKKVINYRVVCW